MNKEIQPSVLLIDDDEKLGELLAEYFVKFNIHLMSAATPRKGLKILTEQQPDLVILDIMLPEMSGFEVCEVIRQQSNIPIIMLTARGEVNDRVTGLAIGADDYLSKPFDPRELVTRIEIILSRVHNEPEAEHTDILQFSQLTINKKNHQVNIKHHPIELTAKEYTLLILMCEHPDKVYSRDDIMTELSGIDSELFSRSVDILVSRLRNKLKPLDYIQTVWGVGYKFSSQ